MIRNLKFNSNRLKNKKPFNLHSKTKISLEKRDWIINVVSYVLLLSRVYLMDLKWESLPVNSANVGKHRKKY